MTMNSGGGNVTPCFPGDERRECDPVGGVGGGGVHHHFLGCVVGPGQVPCAQDVQARAPVWPAVEVVSPAGPALYLAKGFLSEEEANHLIDLATPRFARSSVVSRTTGQNVPDPDRTSSSVFLKRAEDDVVARIERRAADMTGVPLDHFEQLQVVRYEPGQFYKPHHDYLDANLADVKSRGQRAVTVFVYLNNLKEGEEGGGTKFPSWAKLLHRTWARPPCGGRTPPMENWMRKPCTLGNPSTNPSSTA